MDKKVERANKEKVLRLVARRLEPLGFQRTKPTFFTRSRHPIIEFIHVHKYSFDSSFRVHLGVHVASEPFESMGLNGPDSHAYTCANSPSGKKYNLNYHVSPETVDRCALNIFEFVSEVAEPWFVKWRNLTLLAFSDESPLREPARGALIKAMKTN